MVIKSLKFSAIVISLALILSCSSDYSPRPRGYFRIDLPEREYQTYSGDCPFTFSYPAFAEIGDDEGRLSQPCWLNIDFPGYKGRLHLSYGMVDGNLVDYLEDARKLAFRHTVKADAIDESMFINRADDVYGVLYDIKGNTASAVQFYLTDSTNHFFRGALYFNVQPNRDSLAPVIEHFRKDIIHLMETFAWN